MKNSIDEFNDREQALSDLKNRVIYLMESQRDVPLTAWDAEPLRYYKLNLEWVKVLIGWLSWAAEVAFWKGASDELHEGIQGTLEFMKGIELPTMSCEDIEDCLETSPTIDIIEQNITNITNIVNNIVENNCGCNEFPDPPPDYENPDPNTPEENSQICNAAHYIAALLVNELIDAYNNQLNMTLQDFLFSFLQGGGFAFQSLVALWNFFNVLQNQDFITDLQAAQDEITEALFCALLDRQEAVNNLNETSVASDVKEAFEEFIMAYTAAKWTELVAVGMYAPNEDCSGLCDWTVVFDFNSSYIPVGDETAIIVGDSWAVSGGQYSAQSGYTALADIMQITKDLPPQCKIKSYQAWVARGATCLAVDVKFWQRGNDGLQAPDWGAISRVLSPVPTPIEYTVLPINVGALLAQAAIQTNAFSCDNPPPYNQQIMRVILKGTGARPSS